MMDRRRERGIEEERKEEIKGRGPKLTMCPVVHIREKTDSKRNQNNDDQLHELPRGGLEHLP